MTKNSSSSVRATHIKRRSKASTTLTMSLMLLMLLCHISYHDFDASYVLMRNKFGRVVALYVGPHHKRSKTCVWLPKCLVTNMGGPKQIWVPRNKA
jgi:hypothetical protein